MEPNVTKVKNQKVGSIIENIGFAIRYLHYCVICIGNSMICNGNRTEWSPVRSVIIRVITQNRTTAQRESDLFITSMITD